MAGIFDNDDSTDDEIGVNLQLAERLRINREHCRFMEDTSLEDSKEMKQICNMHRKKFAQNGHSSSSSSIEIQSDNMTGVSSDSYHNKKRQNGDKNIEQLANPKRTCLSDRFRKSPEWRDSRKKESNKVQSKHSKFSDPLQVQSPDLFPDKKNEEHVNSLADAEDSDFEIPLRITRNCKKSNGHSSKVNKNHHSGSSEMIQLSNLEKPSTSFFHSFLESGSDDDSKSVMQNGALKGGRPELVDHSSYAKRLFGRKVNKKVLDSDESEEDSSVAVYRSRPLVFSSSDSEKDFRQTTFQSKHAGAASNGTGHSLLYDDGYDRNSRNPRQYKSYRPNQKSHKKTFNAMPSSRAGSSDGCDPQFLSSEFQCKTTPNRSCRTRRSPRMNIAANITSNSVSNGNSKSAPVRGRRVSGADRGSRRAGSPHHRNLPSQNRCDDCRGRSVSSSRSHKDKPSYAARYPDVFDAEESENEFFTANSYSDTETSTESLSAVTINASFPTHRGGTISCSIDCDGDGTTDDEIIVLYSAGPYGRTNEARRGGPRTLGRRFNRGSTPHRQLQNAQTQEVVSLSPDPVEQVRQMEEDERMARMLQAEFDAEVDPDYAPGLTHPVEPLPDTDSDSDGDIDPVGESDSDGILNYHNRAGYFSVMSPPPNRFRMNRFANRLAIPNSVGLGLGTYIGNHRRYNNRRRRYQITPRDNTVDFQIARLFGLGIPTMGDIFSGSDEYETLLSLDLGGEVMPRGLHKSDINRLPTRKYVHPNSATSSAGGSAPLHKRTELNKECQVCLTDYENGDILRILPCFHEFHTPCIDPWLKINHTCPVCRVTVDLDA